MAIRYEYKCPSCEHVYVEQRHVDEPPIITVCNFCRNDNYILEKESEVE